MPALSRPFQPTWTVPAGRMPRSIVRTCVTSPSGVMRTQTCAGLDSVKEMCCRVNCGLMVKRENCGAPNRKDTVGVAVVVAGGVGHVVETAVAVRCLAGVVVGWLVAVGAVVGRLVAVAVYVGTAVDVSVGWLVAVAVGVGLDGGAEITCGGTGVGRDGAPRHSFSWLGAAVVGMPVACIARVCVGVGVR